MHKYHAHIQTAHNNALIEFWYMSYSSIHQFTFTFVGFTCILCATIVPCGFLPDIFTVYVIFSSLYFQLFFSLSLCIHCCSCMHHFHPSATFGIYFSNINAIIIFMIVSCCCCFLARLYPSLSHWCERIHEDSILNLISLLYLIIIWLHFTLLFSQFNWNQISFLYRSIESKMKLFKFPKNA